MWNLIIVIAFIECSLNTWFYLACCIPIKAILTSWYPTRTLHTPALWLPVTTEVSYCCCRSVCKTQTLSRSVSE